jgi:hypothetical protein
LPITDTHCWFEKQVVNEVHPYFMAWDDYFSTPPEINRSSSDAISTFNSCITPTLRDRILQLYPDKKVLVWKNRLMSKDSNLRNIKMIQSHLWYVWKTVESW